MRRGFNSFIVFGSVILGCFHICIIDAKHQSNIVKVNIPHDTHEKNKPLSLSSRILAKDKDKDKDKDKEPKTDSPTSNPTPMPTPSPSLNPTVIPSSFPSIEASDVPSNTPSVLPSITKSVSPSIESTPPQQSSTVEEETAMESMATTSEIAQDEEPQDSEIIEISNENENTIGDDDIKSNSQDNEDLLTVELQAFSLGLLFPSTQSKSSIESVDSARLNEHVQTFLFDYISQRWLSPKPQDFSTASLGMKLSNIELQMLQLFTFSQMELEMASFSTSMTDDDDDTNNDNNKRRHRHLRTLQQDSNSQINMISTRYEGKSFLTIPSFSQYQTQLNTDPPTILQEQRLFLALESKLHLYQQEALTQHMGDLLELVQTDDSSGVQENIEDALKNVEDILSFIGDTTGTSTSSSSSTIGADNTDTPSGEEEGDNEIFVDTLADVNNAANINNDPTNMNLSNEKKGTMLIVMALVTGILGATLIAVGFFWVRKRRKYGKSPKPLSDNNSRTMAESRSNNMIEIQEIDRRPSYYNDDMSSIGMGTAVIRDSPEYYEKLRRQKSLGDDMSQFSYDYSVEGQSIITKQLPKYTSGNDDDDDTIDTSIDLDKILGPAPTNQNPTNNHTNKSNAIVKSQSSPYSNVLGVSFSKSPSSLGDEGTVWTFSKMGQDDGTFEEGVEVGINSLPYGNDDSNSRADDDSIFGFAKLNYSDLISMSPTEGEKSIVSALTHETSPSWTVKDFSGALQNNNNPNTPVLLNSPDTDEYTEQDSLPSIDRGPINPRKQSTQITKSFEQNNIQWNAFDYEEDNHNLQIIPHHNSNSNDAGDNDDYSDAPSDEFTLKTENNHMGNHKNDNNYGSSNNNEWAQFETQSVASTDIMHDLNRLRNVLDRRKRDQKNQQRQEKRQARRTTGGMNSRRWR